MADLPTNYLDDILAQSMNGKRKYRITRADGTFEEVTLEDVSEYEQVGSNFGAGDINKTNQAVNEKFDSGDVVDPMLTTEPGFAADAYQTKLQFDAQNKKLGGLRFGVDGDGNYGYYGADDSLIPFKGIPELTLLHSSSRTSSGSLSYTLDDDFAIVIAFATGTQKDASSRASFSSGVTLNKSIGTRDDRGRNTTAIVGVGIDKKKGTVITSNSDWEGVLFVYGIK